MSHFDCIKKVLIQGGTYIVIESRKEFSENKRKNIQSKKY